MRLIEASDFWLGRDSGGDANLERFFLFFFVWDAGLIQAVVQETNTGGQHNFRDLISLIAANDGRKLHNTSWTLYSCTLYTSLLDI